MGRYPERPEGLAGSYRTLGVDTPSVCERAITRWPHQIAGRELDDQPDGTIPVARLFIVPSRSRPGACCRSSEWLTGD